MNIENTVAKEVAEAEFWRWVNAMELLVEESEISADDKASYQSNKDRIIYAIEKGHLIINEDGEAIYTPYRPKSKNKDPLTWHERTGADLMQMDSKKTGQSVSSTYAVMAGMCKVDQKVFAGLAGNDIKTCEAIFAFLMG